MTVVYGAVYRLMLRERLPEITDLYNRGLSAIKISHLINCSPARVYQLLVQSGQQMRSGRKQRIYKLDESFFQKIESEEKAYWVGFLMADGSVKKNNLSIGLAARDRGHLLKLKIATSFEGPITEATSTLRGKKFPSCVLLMCSKKMIGDLSKVGVVPRKSWCAKPPESLRDDLWRHFWRGVIDGDGSLIICKTTNHIHLVGTKEITQGFSDYVTSRLGGKGTIKPIQNHFGIQFCGTARVGLIVRHLYQGASIYLDRKYERAIKIIAALESEHSLTGKRRLTKRVMNLPA